jgi:hypothetical protein
MVSTYEDTKEITYVKVYLGTISKKELSKVYIRSYMGII